MVYSHDKIDAAELRSTPVGRRFQVVKLLVSICDKCARKRSTHIPDVDIADADDLGTLAHLGDVARRRLRLLCIASDDTCVCTQVDERPRLCAADVAGAARHKGNPSV